MTTALHSESRTISGDQPRCDAAGGHIPAIDGLRGAAVLLVMVAHSILIRPGCRLDQLVADILGAGWCGVDLFFVLSGFLITGILIDAKGGSRYFTSFYMRRTLRIFPVYYVALLLLLIVLPRIPIAQADAYRDIAPHQAWFWFHLSNLHFAQHGFTGDATDVFWSLAIEEQFYLVWPLVVWLCGRRWLMAICAMLMIAALAMRFALLEAGYKPVAAYVFTFARMDGLAAGAFIALLARGPRRLASYIPVARAAAAISAGALVLIIFQSGGLPIWGRGVQTSGYTLLVGLFASLLVLTLNDNPRAWARRCFDRPLLRTFGRYSYAIYIGHLPVRMLLRAIGVDPHSVPPLLGSNLPGQLILTALVVFCSLLLAIVSWHMFEKNILKLKRFFPYETGQPPMVRGDVPSDATGWPRECPAMPIPTAVCRATMS